MLPPGRIPELPAGNTRYHDSAVLVLLFPYRGSLHLCLIRRPATMKNHAGQIAFPGGKKEKDDVDLTRTALREAQEETGLDSEQVEILGQLSPVYVQVSDFLITPVVGWMNEKPEDLRASDEVDEVIFVSLADLSNPCNRTEREMETRFGRIIAPGYAAGGHFIWGATAMIVAELVDLCTEPDQL